MSKLFLKDFRAIKEVLRIILQLLKFHEFAALELGCLTDSG
jgi:hypothetical protein